MGRLGGGCGRGERCRWRWWRSAMAAASEGESQERGGGENRGGRGVSRRGDREEVEPPARSRRWSLRARRFLTATAAALGRGEEDDRGGKAPGGLGRTGGLPAQELGRLLAPGGALGGLQVGGPGRLLLLFIFLFCFLLLNLLPLF